MYVWNLRNKLGPEIQAWELFVQISFKIKSLVNYTSLKSKNKLRTQERKKILGNTYPSKKERGREMLREVERVTVLNDLEVKRGKGFKKVGMVLVSNATEYRKVQTEKRL